MNEQLAFNVIMKFLFKINKNLLTRSLTTKIFNNILPNNNGHLALVSVSNNIYYNLALESYIAETYDLKNRNILLIWLSEPCIVVGRHQNPWLECNVKEAYLNKIRMARRYSGGGCVYHDLGNLNISFIVDRLKYDRKHNLNIIKETLESKKFNLKSNQNIVISPRHDIFIKDENTNNELKITGSASRLARQYSYHHCTLLFDSNLTNISSLLKSNLAAFIKTKATPSVPSKCANMKNFTNFNLMTTQDVIHLICEKFWSKNWSNWSIPTLFNYINPEDPHLVSLYREKLNELKSWEFQFAATPQFELTVNKRLKLIISNGLVKEYYLKEEVDENINDLLLLKSHLDKLIGVKFVNNEINNAFNSEFIESNQDLKNIQDFFNKNI